MAYKSRSSTEKFLVGQTREYIPDNKLPTNRDVLKYLFFKHQEESNKSKKTPAISDLICCPLNREFEAQCQEENGCGDKDPCVVRAIKIPWNNGGYKTVQDRSIR